MMERRVPTRSPDPASLGAEALPAGFREMSQAIGEHRTAGADTPLPRERAPLMGLIALAALWMRKRGGRA
jgi:hypothetical protein